MQWLGVVHQTVSNGVAAHADTLPERPPQPDAPVETAALDKLYTFIGDKKCLLILQRYLSPEAVLRTR